MVKSMYAAVAGLKTHQSKMDVIGNNIANVTLVVCGYLLCYQQGGSGSN